MDRERRTRLVDALHEMADEDDATALDAARRATAILAESGLDWEDAIVYPARAEAPFMADFDHGAIDIDGEDQEGAPVVLDEGDETVGRLLQSLLDLPELGAETRAEVKEYAEELAAGTLDGQDRRYVAALAARLGVRRN
ncbi:hypothetical protein L2U69_01125 [Zavarzinia compransoris]|uniref:hypothetical protein n=1 Tax=Zavarzinia marina TaxID=2911065 RepID=UPI001F1D2AD6|nr:hypothetical protein [Zavarzinia marina]MCF4164245.1 hypothetical protein [Zavarzinia marina]